MAEWARYGAYHIAAGHHVRSSQISLPEIYEGSWLLLFCDLDTFLGLLVSLSTFCPFETFRQGR